MTTMSQFFPSFLASQLLFLFRNRRPTMSSSLLLLLRCWVISANTLHDSDSTCYCTVGGDGRNEPEIREREKTQTFIYFLPKLRPDERATSRVEERGNVLYV